MPLSEPDLLRSVLESPEDDTPRLVLADRLLERGDPRGELIQLQCAAEKFAEGDPRHEEIRERGQDLLAEHETSWTAELRRGAGLTDHLAQVSFRRGFPEILRADAEGAAGWLDGVAEKHPIVHLSLDVKRVEHLVDLGSCRAALRVPEISLREHRGLEGAKSAFLGWAHAGNLRRLHLRSSADDPAVCERFVGLTALTLTFATPEVVAALGRTKHLQSLRSLALPSTRLGLQGARAIAAGSFPEIVSLDLSGDMLTATEMEALAGGVPRLRRLDLSRANQVGAAGAAAIAAHLTSLEILDIEGNGLGAEGANALASLPLRKLDISGNALGRAGWSAVTRMHSLEVLASLSNGVDATIDLPQLHTLDLSMNNLGDQGVAALAATNPALRRLRLRATSCGEEGAAALGGRQGLVSLDLSLNPIGDGGLRKLVPACAALERLHVRGCQLGAGAVDVVASLPALRHLDITGLAATALPALLGARLPAMRTLVVDGFGDDAARVLARSAEMPLLRELVAAGPLTDAGAVALAESPALQRILWLELNTPDVGDRGRAALRRRFGHHHVVLDGGLLHAFSALSRRV